VQDEAITYGSTNPQGVEILDKNRAFVQYEGIAQAVNFLQIADAVLSFPRAAPRGLMRSAFEFLVEIARHVV
jgi:hypothetical protein